MELSKPVVGGRSAQQRCLRQVTAKPRIPNFQSMRKLIVIFICCIVVLLGGYVGYHWYKVKKQNHLIGMAQQFLAKSDNQKAFLCLQLVLHSNPNNVEAIRMMADLAGSRAAIALPFRKRVVELNPNSTDDKLSLAQTAIILGDYNLATNTLESVSAEGKKTASFQNVAGTVAESAGQLAEAEAHFSQALRLEPTIPAIQLNLAKVRLHGTNLTTKPEARTVLARIADNPGNAGLSVVALRELIGDARRSQQLENAVAFSKKLVQQTNSSFNDQLLRLDLLKQTGNAEFKSALTGAERAAGTDAGKIHALATWQMANTTLEGNLSWLRSLPPNIQTNYPTSLAIAQCLVFQPNWQGLRNWVQNQNWGEYDFMRHAFLARALKELNLNATSETEWQKAVSMSGNDKPNLVILLRLADQWNWESKGEDILWNIVNRFPGDQVANATLGQVLFTSGRTRPLMTLYGQQLNWSPTNLSIKNNLTMCALLLDAQELKPNDLARSLFEQDPNDPSYLSTYAFSLHLQKKDVEALRIIEKLNPDNLKKPSVAGYYGLILKATGNPAKAKIYFDIALKSNLLPEERKIFDQARSGV
jgi:tetratricopeptide (TPR) repeat protein